MALTGVNEKRVLEALRPVTDPELNVSIVDLDMVRGVDIRRGQVTVTIALTVPGCPMKDEVTRRVRSAVEGVKGVREVAVELTSMTPAELEAVRVKLAGRGESDPAAWASTGGVQAGGGPAAATGAGHQHGPARRPLGHEEGRANQFGPRSATRVIGISSGKGGVGKSSITVNLAVSLARQGHDVAVLDADVYGFSVPGMLGVHETPTVKGQKMTPPVAFGVKCMSMGFFIDDEQPVIWRGPMLHKALEQFLVDVDWGDPEFLLVDMPPGTGDVALSMAQYLPTSEVYVVTTPQPAARRVAQRSAFMAKKLNLPLRGVIENMSWMAGPGGERQYPFGQGGGEELAAALKVPLLGQVPLDPSLRQGGDEGSPVAATDPESEAGKAFTEIARALVARGRPRVFHPELTLG
ncbi:MAG TPA: Mrp/NBP35 family ATP-binding protein [Acidimicrobiales bacterium]|nr:Mrp/NBP35 family ATP-binding protein [Acidimicrobiales bacterium]